MIVLVGLAGGLGAALRWIASGSGDAKRRRAATSSINLIGSLALGVMVGLFRSGRLSEDALLVVGVGLLGGFTTFSTWTVDLVEEAKTLTPMVARTGPVLVAGLVLAWLGIAIVGGFN